MMVSEIKFILSVGTLGSERMSINIPKKYYEKTKDMDKDVIVNIRELFGQ